MEIVKQGRLDENPIIFENFSPSIISVGNLEIETSHNEDSVFINPTMAGKNTAVVKYNQPSKLFKITINASQIGFSELKKAINDYIEESKKNGYAKGLKVAVAIPAFNVKITSMDAIWERPLFTGSIYDPNTTMELRLKLVNSKEEDLY